MNTFFKKDVGRRRSTGTSIIADKTSKEFQEKFKKGKVDPLSRTGKLFGGLIGDVKRRAPHYLKDYTDALHLRCLVVMIFTYFSFLAPTIIFGVLMSKVTQGLMGISEIIFSTSMCGIAFGLFSGQPLIIVGATGPMFVMEESIYLLATEMDIEYLPWRVWIGFWVTLFCFLIVMFDLNFLVKQFTLFTEEIIAALVSMIFIYESFSYLDRMFGAYPLHGDHHLPHSTMCNSTSINTTNSNNTAIDAEANGANGNIALMSTILMFATFLAAFYNRKFRHSEYFPLKFRRLLSDFGILIAVFFVVTFDVLIGDDFTPKLHIPDGLTPSVPGRGWLIPLMGQNKPMLIGHIFFAAVPAFLVTIVLFMETLLTGTIINKKDHKLKKGAGYSLDLLVVGVLESVCGVFGLPWVCACPVLSVSHLNSLSILSTKHVPGTKPRITKVLEQRVTNLAVNILIGLSVFLAPMLRQIPIAVAFGIFLYLGFISLTHLQLVQRIKLLFMPSKNHPDLRYIRKVKTWKIHCYTGIQVACFVLQAIVKNSILSPGFPFGILLMIPLRHLIKKIFSPDELEELDQDHDNAIEDNLDEYEVVHVPM